MKYFLKIVIVLLFLFTCELSTAFIPYDPAILDGAIQELKEYASYMKGKDSFYTQLTQIGLNVKRDVQTRCPYSEIDRYISGMEFNKIQVCFQSLNLRYPGSSYTPTTGGYVRFGNYIVYLNPAPEYNFTKIVYEGDYTVQAAVLSNDPVLKEIVYNVYVRIGNREAVFTLQKDGIKEIQNISTIYDIQRKFLTASTQVTENQLLFDLVKYYQFLKSQKKGLSSFDFIQSMLLDLRAQSDFVKFAIAIQQENKK